jgi:hypothetical protein
METHADGEGVDAYLRAYGALAGHGSSFTGRIEGIGQDILMVDGMG